MARKATKTTYGTELVGGVEVRRLIVAGDPIPDRFTVPDDAVETTDQPASATAESLAGGEADPADDPENLEDLTIPELQDRLDARNIEYKASDKKDDLIAKLEGSA